MGRILVKEGGKRNRDESTGIRNNRLKTRSSQLPSQPHRHAYSIHGSSHIQNCRLSTLIKLIIHVLETTGVGLKVKWETKSG